MKGRSSTEYGAGICSRIVVGVIALAVVIAAGGCARYAPVPPPPPKDRILEIRLLTEEVVSDDYYYYIVFNTDNDPDIDGPWPYLSGAERAKNWSYYIVLKDGFFSENIIEDEEDRDDEPTIFNSTSSRYYYTTVSGRSITVRMLVNNFIGDNIEIKMNFITSLLPLTPTDEAIQALDYIEPPFFGVINRNNENINYTNYPAVSDYTVDEQEHRAADITEWYIRVYEI